MLGNLVHIFINPTIWLFAGAVALVVAFMRRPRTGADARGRNLSGTRGHIGALIWLAAFYLFTTPWLPGYVAGQLETPYTPLSETQLNELQAQDGPVRIIALGSGYRDMGGLPAMQRLTNAGLKRTLEAYRLAEALPDARVLTSGYSLSGRYATADIARQALTELGLSEQRMSAQPEPRNTRGEARWYTERFGTGETVVLVTSATHMRRSLAWFEYYGVDNLHAAPADYHAYPEYSEGWRDFIPDPHHLRTLHRAIVEYVGYTQVWLANLGDD